MICESCRQAADIITGPVPPCPGRAAELHALYCAGGTWCDCAHKLPPSYKGCGAEQCAGGECLADAH